VAVDRRPQRRAFRLLPLARPALLGVAFTPPPSPGTPQKGAAIVTVYRHNSHADLIVRRLLLTDTLDAKARSRACASPRSYRQKRHGHEPVDRGVANAFPSTTPSKARLTLAPASWPVDGILLIAEHGEYPKSPTGNTHTRSGGSWARPWRCSGGLASGPGVHRQAAGG